MMSRRISLLSTVTYSLLFFCINHAALGQSSGATYYVAPWGNNQNSGTNAQSPWQSLSYATYQMHAGDTLFVRGGMYSNQGFTIPAGVGTPTSPLRIVAYPGEAPVLTGSETYAVAAEIYSSTIIDGLHFENLTNVTNAVDIWGNYVTVQNCTFKNVPFQFIRVMGADHVTIQNNYMDGNGQLQQDGLGDAIYIGSGTHVLVQNNYDTRAGHYFFDAMALPSQNPSSQIVVRDNTVESFWGGGIGHGSAQNLVYENNRLRHVGEGVPYIKASFEIAGMGSIVRYNVMTDEAAWYSDNVLDIVAEDNGGTQDALHNRVYNNVFYKNGYMPIFESQRWERDLSDNKVLNNIMYYNETGGAAFYNPPTTTYIGIETYHAYPQCPNGSPDCTNYVWAQFPNANYFDNNLILHADVIGDHPGAAQITYTPNTTLAGWTLAGFVDTLTTAQGSYSPYLSGNIEQNPQFVNADAGNFELQPSSPAIAAGAHLAHAAAAGTATTIVPVDDPYFFSDGYGIIPGDTILVGNNPAVSITSVNTANGTLTVSTAVSFAAGDPVDQADHNGSAADLGAFEYSTSSPSVSSVGASLSSATAAVVTWSSSTAASSQVAYGTTTAYGQTSVNDRALETGHTVALSGLWPNTTYHYAVISVDASGGRTVSGDSTFTTFSPPGPAISNVSVSGVSSGGAMITWTTDSPSNSQVFYSGPDLKYTWNPGYVNSSAIGDSGGVVTHSVSIAALLPNTMYHFAVQSTDGNGETSYSADQTFVTQTIPSAGPAISNIAINATAGPIGWFAGTPGESFAPSEMNCCGYSYAQATFSWNTSTPTTQNKVLLIPTVGGGYIQSAELDAATAVPVSGNPSATTTPSLTVYQLAPNTTYVYIIQSTDAAGNTTTSPNYEFTTPSTAATAAEDSVQAQARDAGLTGAAMQHIVVGADGAVWGVDQSGEIFSYSLQSQTWTQIGGSLSQIAIGSSNAVWGLNAAGQIYRWDGGAQTWDWIPGNLSQIAVGADGSVWGINGEGEIYRFNSQSQSWVQVPGSLRQIAVGFDGAVWGINFADQVYRFNPGTGFFVEVAGSLTQIAVGADGDVWGLNNESIYHFNRLTQDWDQIPGTLAEITVGTGANVWGLSSAGQIYEYNAEASSWISVPGTLRKITAGGDGAVWGVDSSNNIYQFIEPSQPAGVFHEIPGTLMRIAAGADGSIWGINSAGQTYTYNSATQSWAYIAGELSQIAVGTGESVWALNSGQQIYRYDSKSQSWDWIEGNLAQISVGANGDVWGINGAGDIFRFVASSQSWKCIPGSLATISVGADGSAWGLNGENQIFEFDATKQTWKLIPGDLIQISVGSSQNIWGVNANGSAYRFNSPTQSWIYVPGANLTHIAAAFDGAVWGIDSANQVFEFDVQTQSWSQISGSLTQIAVAADAVVWGLDANGSIYQYR